MHRARLALALAAGVACTSTPDTREAVNELLTASVVTPPGLDLEVESVQTELPSQDTGPYRIGVNDVLHVEVTGRPEFGRLVQSRRGQLLGGRRVHGDGNVYLPLVGAVPARSKTMAEFRANVSTRLQEFLATPDVTVEVIDYRSQKFFVLGHVHRPGTFAVDGTQSLLEAIGLAGGIRDDGDLDAAYVIRGRTLLPISLRDLLLRGDTSRNITMAHGDLVYVPDAIHREIYVVGEVQRPGAFPMSPRGMTLAAALARAGGLDMLHADKGGVYVYRGSWQAPRSFRLTYEDVLKFGAQIPLRAGDRVHVSATGYSNFGRALSLLTPFLQTVITGAVAADALGD